MSIKLKLVIGFLVIVALHLGIEFWNLVEVKKTFQKEIGLNSATLATEIMDKIDRDLFRKIEVIKEFVETEEDLKTLVQESNQFFAGLGSEEAVQALINSRDKEWMEADEFQQIPLMDTLMKRPVSLHLQEIKSFYQKEYGYDVFAEIFITNQYGANVAQTGKTSDYRQDDEHWWQEGKANGIWVGDVAYDQSAEVYSLDIILELKDQEGQFIGMLKAVLNIQEIYQILNDLKNESKYQSYQVELISKSGEVIYPHENLSESSDYALKKSSHANTLPMEIQFLIENSENGTETLNAFARSKGYRSFKGLEWIIVLSMNTSEIFKPVDELKTKITILALIITLLSIAIGLFISISTLRPILNLVKITKEISKNNDYSLRAQKASNDEISDLIDGFNSMLMKIQERGGAMAQSEAELKESELHLKQVIDLIPHPINAKDVTGKILLANRAQGELFGVPSKTLVGQKFQSYLDTQENVLEQIANDDREVIESGQVKMIPEVTYEYQGKSWLFQVHKMPFTISGIKSVLSVSVDITELKKVQREIQELNKNLEKRVTDQTTELRRTILQLEGQHQKLQESESRLRQVIDLIPHPIYAKDREGTFHLVNRAQAELYDTSVKKLVNFKQRDTLKHKDKLKSIQQEDKEVIENGIDVFIPETSFLDNRGHDHVYQVQKRPFKIGNIETALGVSVDITELKKVQNELLQVQNFLNSIIDSMPSILVGVNLQGLVTQWNKEAEKRTGIQAEQAQGKSLTDVFPKLVSHLDQIQEAIKNRQTLHEEKIVYQDHEENQISNITVYPLIAENVEGAVIRIDDVTEQTRLEEVIVQSEKMMSVGGLAAGMAHEINNPLAGIIQGIQVIQNRLSLEFEKNHQAAQECGIELSKMLSYMEKRQILEFLHDIRESGNRAANIVSNMLQFSRGSTSSKEEADLSELINRVVELASNDYDLKKHYDFRQIEIIREFDSSCPKVFCILIEIEQVLLNLIKNAGQAIKDRKETDPAWNSPRIVLRFFKEEQHVQIEVEDNGSGMKEANRKRIFEPFFTTKDVGVGTGLGLSVSYFIITENHKGSMSVESQSGLGSKFIIKIPI
ncbi:MAG: PAS domain S-box protein [SAR324 cluster bacterium]|nr:PAS domain S-box protein [SAR324 cluster bacterium]